MHARWNGVLAVLVAGCCLLGRPAAADIVVNGNFGTGSLAGFTVYTTPNGSNGFGLPNVVLFDTTGGGASYAAHFNVGDVLFDRTGQGGGLSQVINIATAGLYRISEDIAAQDFASFGNADAGTFSLLLDGAALTSSSLGVISGGQLLRDSLASNDSAQRGLAHTAKPGDARVPERFQYAGSICGQHYRECGKCRDTGAIEPPFAGHRRARTHWVDPAAAPHLTTGQI